MRSKGRSLVLGPTADAMLARLKQLASTRGSAWPTKSVVGAAGVHAVYLLTQATRVSRAPRSIA